MHRTRQPPWELTVCSGRARQAWVTDSPGAWGGLVSQRRAEESRYFGFDPFHNTRFLTGPDGEITDSYLYGAFGDELASSGSTLNAFRYGGKYGYYRDGAERNYVRERYLNTDVGRWLSAVFFGRSRCSRLVDAIWY